MFLTELAELVRDSIEAAPPETWVGPSGVDSLTNVPVRLALDPFTETKDYDPAIYVIPGYVQYTNAGSRGRSGLVSFSQSKIITLAVCVRIRDMDTQGIDITTWAEGKKLLELKECLDRFILRLDLSSSKVRITDTIETEPPDEIRLDHRYFLATTVIGYDAC